MPERDLENLRSSYRPSKITLLLVGESPPPHKGFFYDVDAPEGTLSRNTRRSFEESFATQYLNRKEFLKDFSSKGCYLVDLFRHRGRTVYRANSHERESAVVELSRFIREVKPVIVVAVLKRISRLAEKAVDRSQVPVRYEVLPYPTRNYLTQYRLGLKRLLSELDSRSES